jgi:hypothetical protein
VTFEFNPLCFVQPGYEKSDGDWPQKWVSQIVQIRESHPELKEWGLFPVGSAWGDYSQDIMAVGWVDWIKGRDSAFLAYIYVRQLVPGFDFGGTGLYSTDVEKLGDEAPWLGTVNVVPQWAQRS